MASKWQKLFGNIAQIALPILGGAIGGPGGAAIGGAAGGALSGKKGGLKQAAIGAGLGYGGAKLGGVQGQGFGNFMQNPLKSLGSSYGNIFKGSGSGSGGGFGGGSNWGSSLGSQMVNNFTTSNQPAMNTMTQESSRGGGLMSKFKNPLLMGAGIMGASQLIKSPQVPELPLSVIDFQNMAKQGNPLQNQASAALRQQLGQTQQNASEDEIAALTRQYQQAQGDEVEKLQSLYRSARPGTDYINDSSYQRDLARINDRFATLRADSVANFQRQISNDFNNQRVQQIAQAAGLSQQQMQQMASVGQYDLDRQLAQLQISDRDRQTLRDYLLQFGGTMALNQLDPAKALEMQLMQKMLTGGFN